jgi:Fe-S cluster assembly protein SufB
MTENVVLGVDLDDYRYGFRDDENYVFKSRKGLDHEIVDEISWMKGEPDWMRALRHKSLDIFYAKPVPTWGGDLSRLDYNDLYYYIKPVEEQGRSWDDVPDDIKRTFDRLGIPEAERKFLAGAGAQYESEAVYHSLKEEWERLGVVFLDSDSGLRDYPEFYKEYFGTVVPAADNKYAALNTAVWSGGSFVYVPPGVKVDIPLQAYFRINAENMGQFERTLIVADEGSQVHYVEGCTAPTYSTDSFHSGVIEIIVKKGARVRYTTIQNWSHNVYNLVTQRALAYEDATMEWVDGNLGSKLTMKYPAVYMMGRGAKAEILSIAFANKNQHQDAGAKVVHGAPHTTSTITAKSISKSGGRAGYRGIVKVQGHLRTAGDDDDRQRLHRAHCQRATDGIRGRDEPPHPTRNGRLRRLAGSGYSGQHPLPNTQYPISNAYRGLDRGICNNSETNQDCTNPTSPGFHQGSTRIPVGVPRRAELDAGEAIRRLVSLPGDGGALLAAHRHRQAQVGATRPLWSVSET